MKDASSAIGFDGIENEPMIDLTSRTSALTRARMRVQEVDVFWAGTAALTAGLAAVLGWFLHAWPPHEDEALALFVGRGSLGSVLHTVIAERGRKRPADRATRCAPRRPDGRPRGGAPRGRHLGAALPRDLRAHVQPLPLYEPALVPRARVRARQRPAARLRPVGTGAAGGARKPSLRRARDRRAGIVCRPAARTDARSARDARPPRRRRHSLLVGRPRPAQPLRRRCGRRRSSSRLTAIGAALLLVGLGRLQRRPSRVVDPGAAARPRRNRAARATAPRQRPPRGLCR